MTSSATGYLRPALLVTGAVGVLGAIVGLVVRGWPGLFGVLAGTAIVVLSYLISTFVVAWVDKVKRSMLLVAALGTYAIKFTVLFVFVGWMASLHWAGTLPLAAGVLAAVLAWTGTQIWWTSRAKFTLEV
ncbi:MAG: hypothetical protein HOU81_11940 [Hamadaea sp.]|uniref:hypothetical protein n=1 Tax=Hamadaea sp. TaxID=2024425 RepID=UPI0017F7166A|nr:hypothetical protein [Hamadaea sp.]NUR71521.1 hypothetical protein [Hamadaea sp.]NUT23656.1 hypothetical protein [Hamadaea sp.]